MKQFFVLGLICMFMNDGKHLLKQFWAHRNFFEKLICCKLGFFSNKRRVVFFA